MHARRLTLPLQFFDYWNTRNMKILTNMKIYRFIRHAALGSLFCTTLFLAACFNSTDPSEAYQGESEQHIFSKGEEALRDRNNGEAIKRFEALDVQYPFGPYTEKAQFHIIYAYYMKEEYVLAVAAADRFIRQHPLYPYIDYVYYIRGLSDFYQNLGVIEKVFSVNLATRDLTQIRKAWFDFAELVQRFPNSRYAPAAHQYMIYLRNLMADHELDVAQFYYDRKAYVAAANRASLIVAHYQGAPAVKDALVLMVKSYRHLRQTRQEQETLSVLRYNYPEMEVSNI